MTFQRAKFLFVVPFVLLFALLASLLLVSSAPDASANPDPRPVRVADEPDPLCGSFRASIGVACNSLQLEKLVRELRSNAVWACPATLSDARILEIEFYEDAIVGHHWTHWCEPIDFGHTGTGPGVIVLLTPVVPDDDPPPSNPVPSINVDDGVVCSVDMGVTTCTRAVDPSNPPTVGDAGVPAFTG